MSALVPSYVRDLDILGFNPGIIVLTFILQGGTLVMYSFFDAIANVF
jgi:hypothetical protein